MSAEAIHNLMRDEKNGLPKELLKVQQIKSYMGNMSNHQKKAGLQDIDEEEEDIIEEASTKASYECPDTTGIILNISGSLSDSESDSE